MNLYTSLFCAFFYIDILRIIGDFICSFSCYGQGGQSL